MSLQDSSVKSETETIKQIEKRWVLEQDATKDLKKDVLLNQSAAVVADLAEIKTVPVKPDSQKLPLSH